MWAFTHVSVCIQQQPNVDCRFLYIYKTHRQIDRQQRYLHDGLVDGQIVYNKINNEQTKQEGG